MELLALLLRECCFHIKLPSVTCISSPVHHIKEFRLRIINQQTGAFMDTPPIYANRLPSQHNPLVVKLKAAQRVLLKIKLIGKKKQEDTLIGEGHVPLDKQAIDTTLRVHLYDVNHQKQEVSLCRLDFVLTGYAIERLSSPNKSLSKVQQLKDRTEVISDVSYTLSDGNQSIKDQNQLMEDQVQQEKVSQNQENLREKILFNNKTYSDKQKEEGIIKQNVQNPAKNRNILQTIEQADHIGEQQTINPLSLKKKIQQNDKLINTMKRYLKMNEENNKINQRRNRRPQIKVQELSAYKDHSKFIKKHQEFTPSSLVLKNIKFVKNGEKKIRNLSQFQTQNINFDRLTLADLEGKILLTLDVMAYRSYCRNNQIRELPAQINLPAKNTIKVYVITAENQEMQGTMGIQQGQGMAIYLRNKQVKNNKILSLQQCKLYFDIVQRQSDVSKKSTIEVQHLQFSFRESNDDLIVQSDVRKRIQSLSQPWNLVKAASLPSSNFELQGQNQSNQQVSKSVKNTVKNQIQANLAIKKNQYNSSFDIRNLQKSLVQRKSLPKRHQKMLSQLNMPETPKKSVNSSSDLSSQNKKQSKSYFQYDSQKAEQSRFASKRSSRHSIKNQNDDNLNIRNGNRTNFRIKQKSEEQRMDQLWKRVLKRKKEEQMSEIESYRRQVNFSVGRRQPNSIKTKIIKTQDSEEQYPRGITPSFNKKNKISQPVRKNIVSPKNSSKNSKSMQPLRNLTVQINSISITQPHIIVQQSDKGVGKFIRISGKDHFSYFTQVIRNGPFDSVLWRLSGCLFDQVMPHDRLELELYETDKNKKIFNMGKTSLRFSKLFFLRNNHVYNGLIYHQSTVSAQFTISFSVRQNNPVQMVKKDDSQPRIYQQATKLESQESLIDAFNQNGSRKTEQNVLRQSFNELQQLNEAAFDASPQNIGRGKLRATLKKQRYLNKKTQHSRRASLFETSKEMSQNEQLRQQSRAQRE